MREGDQMELSSEQKQAVSKWISEGSGLSDVQKRLSEEFGVSMTYMDVRFLVLDLGLEVKDGSGKEEHEKPETAGESDSPEDILSGELQKGVSVELDRVVKPGSIVSGTVMFSDGKSGSWMLDQMGRLALDTGSPDYRPSQEDMQAFQEELKSALERKGF